MKIRTCVSLYLLLAAACVVQATHRYYSRWQCSCNGRSQYCLQDSWGLHCINCQGNSTGRHCERCMDGFYQQVTGAGCSPCGCNPVGSINSICDSKGQCYCKDGVTGEKCSQCSDGPIGPDGCTRRRQLREDSASPTLPCFCYGHSSQCSAQLGYSIHPITSNFTDGLHGWKTTAVHDVGPNDILLRWSLKHQDLEVISTSSLPVYLSAPGSYLGNQLLSYGQNLSFSLRLDHSVRQLSYDDVILEGAGLRVAAPLGVLGSSAPCRQKKNYSFRLDEKPSSGWRPQLSTLQFQMLLQNLTALKIRATFGQGRGYLDDVQLVSAQRGEGSPAHWVRTCSCPLGYEGDFCEQCSATFKRSDPGEGAFSSCEPCSCRGGSCDPHTGDCYAADETWRAGELSCPPGFYKNRWYPDACFKCPCPDGVSCTVKDGSVQPHCDRCPPGTTGTNCDVCEEGFYGDPVGNSGVQQPCQPCQCNGHISVSSPGSCDGRSGECLKCVNNTTGRSCESCLPDFYHSQASDACRSCNCDLRGSKSSRCDSLGRCQCKPGFEGIKCQLSNCPACFSSIKIKMKEYATKLEEILFLNGDGGHNGVNAPEMEAGLINIEQLLNNLQFDMEKLTGLERKLQNQLSSTNTTQMTNRQHIQNIDEVKDNVQQQHQSYNRKVDEVQNLLEEIKQKLDQAKNNLRSAEVPSGDAPQGSGLSALLQMAARLADVHQREADVIQQSSSDALNKSEKSLALARALMSNENKVKELVGDLKNTYDQTSTQVKALKNRAEHLSSEATDENILAANMLKDITNLEQEIPSGLKDGADSMASLLSDLTAAANRGTEDFDAFQNGVEQNRMASTNLLTEGRASGQVETLLNRVEAAKVDTKDALQRISGNTDQLRDSLNSLKGFNHQIKNYKNEADVAIQRLNGINSTIQQAVSNNDETQAVLRDMSVDYDQTLGTINLLEGLVNSIEGTFRSLPPQNELLKESTKLKGDSENLKVRLDRMGRDMNIELDAVRRLEDESLQVAAGAVGAFNNAQQSRAAVDQTLREINSLFTQLNQSGGVDQEQLQQMEDSLTSAQREVEQTLRPWLRDVEVQEAAHKRRLFGINSDIDNILADIGNLKDIFESIPNDCFNTSPIENA